MIIYPYLRISGAVLFGVWGRLRSAKYNRLLFKVIPLGLLIRFLSLFMVQYHIVTSVVLH